MDVVGRPSTTTTAWLCLGRTVCSNALRKSWGTFSARTGDVAARDSTAAAATGDSLIGRSPLERLGLEGGIVPASPALATLSEAGARARGSPAAALCGRR